MAYLRQCEGQVDNWICATENKANRCADSFRLPPGRFGDYRDSNISNVVFANGETARAAKTGGLTVDNNENGVKQAKQQAELGVGLGVVLPLLNALACSMWFLNRKSSRP